VGWREILLSLLLGVLANEFSDISPWLARRLVWWAASLWAEEPDQVAVYRKKGTVLINGRPGKLLKLMTAIGFASGAVVQWQSRSLRRHVREALDSSRGFRRKLVTATIAMIMIMVGLEGVQQAIEPAPPIEYLSGMVNIGVSSDLPGWSTNQNGRWAGFEIEMASWLGRRFGFTPNFVPVLASQAVQALREGRVKLVISHLSITDVRAQYIGFAGPYFVDRAGLLTSPTKLNGQSPVDLSRICVVAGTSTMASLMRRGTPQVGRSLADCMRRYYDPSDDIAGVVTDESILSAYQPNGNFGVAKFDGESGPITIERFGIGFFANFPELCRALSASIDDYLRVDWDASAQAHLNMPALPERKPKESDWNLCVG
jgi:ABC-type amino acid transport substrate-binding protein